MKVTKVTHIASGDLWAGAEVQIFQLIQELHLIPDMQISAIIFNDGKLYSELNKLGINVILLDECKFSSILLLPNLIQILRRISPDIIHTHGIKQNILAASALLFLRKCRAIQTVHGGNEHKPKFYQIHNQILQLINLFIGKYIHSCICVVSNQLKLDLQSSYPVQKLLVVENGLNTNLINHQINIDSTVLDISDGELVIGFVGRLSPVKRIDIFLDIAEEIINEGAIKASFYVLGDGPLRQYTQDRININGNEHQIKCLGFVDNIGNYINCMDILLLTSDHEGLPTVLLECLYLKTTIIAHAVGGIPDLLNRGKYGVLIKQQKPLLYVKAIKEFVLNRDKYTKMSEQGSGYLLLNYTSKDNALKYYSLYSKLANTNI